MQMPLPHADMLFELESNFLFVTEDDNFNGVASLVRYADSRVHAEPISPLHRPHAPPSPRATPFPCRPPHAVRTLPP